MVNDDGSVPVGAKWWYTRSLLPRHRSSKQISGYHRHKCSCLSKVSSTLPRVKVDSLVNPSMKLWVNNMQHCAQLSKVASMIIGWSLVLRRRGTLFQPWSVYFIDSKQKKLSYKVRVRARRERAVLKSLVTLLHHRPDVVVRRTDKSKVFYVGNAAAFARKAMQYMIDTESETGRHQSISAWDDVS